MVFKRYLKKKKIIKIKNKYIKNINKKINLNKNLNFDYYIKRILMNFKYNLKI